LYDIAISVADLISKMFFLGINTQAAQALNTNIVNRKSGFVLL